MYDSFDKKMLQNMYCFVKYDYIRIKFSCIHR